ncbi:MAG: hypothetical protein WKF96_08140 [Solirubrobacteraceae bacterium]
MREIAQVVKKPDVGQILASVGAEDPLRDDDSVPKRKRIVAALIATDHREPNRSWIDRLLAAVDRYDGDRYVERVERLAEHVVEHDTIRQVAARVPAWSGDQRDVSAHIGLTYWGGKRTIARHALVLIREGNRETQIELDIDGTSAVIAGLTRAHHQLVDSKRYLETRQRTRRST